MIFRIMLTFSRVHTTSSIRAADSTDDAIPKAGTTSDTVMKWALQWRSIILSSLGKTTYPYCLYIRSLDLTNLKELFEDPVFIKNSLYDQFFKGDLNFLVKTQGTVTRRPRLKTSSVTLVDKVGELICKYTGESAERNGGTAALEEVSGEIQKESLPKWIRWLPRLRSLTLWTGDILDGSVADVIKYHCPDFDSLTLLFCMGSRVDANLFSFFGGLRSNSLRALLVHNHHDAGPQTFLSLNNHRASLKQLTLGSLKEPALKSLSLLKGCTAIETLDLEDLTGSIDLEATENDTFLEIIAWLTSCKQLKSICLKKFVNGPRILTSVCLEHSIKLNSLSLETYNLSGNQEFHRALAQHTSLTSVELRGDAEDSFRDDIDTLVECLCKLKNLKYLDILGISDFFKTSEIQLLAMHLSKVHFTAHILTRNPLRQNPRHLQDRLLPWQTL